MKRLSLLTVIFALLSVVFFLLLIFFRTPFPLYPFMSWQDALDILTPLVLIPIYWLMFRYGSSERPRLAEEIVFLLFACLWIAGQGMHLSANSINNLAEGMAKSGLLNILDTNVYQLAYFFDEHLSHYMWHLGVIGLAALIIFRQWSKPAEATTNWWLVVPAGILYGFTCFCFFLEGQTVILGFPFAAIITLVILIWQRKALKQRPIMAFFLVSFLVATLFFTGWAAYYQGFPQFSDVGLI
jgi:hypothetical protein